MALTLLGSAVELLVATGHDPYARGSPRRPLARGWLAGQAVAWMGIDAEERVAYLNSLGPPAEVGALLADLLPELPPTQRVTVPQGVTAQAYWWQLAIANSQVFTRRIVVNAKSL